MRIEDVPHEECEELEAREDLPWWDLYAEEYDYEER